MNTQDHLEIMEQKRIKFGLITSAVISLFLFCYFFLPHAEGSSDNIGVFVIPTAAIGFYGPLSCWIASWIQAKKLINSLDKEAKAAASAWRLAMKGMPIGYRVTGLFGFALILFPLTLPFYLLAPIWFLTAFTG